MGQIPVDEIIIESLKLSAYVGINQWEQKIKQTLLVDIHLFYDFSHTNDKIEETINYDALCQNIEAYVEQRNFQLIETIANEIANEIFTQFPVQRVKISVSKPYALRQAKNVKVIAIRLKE